jgi:choline dehydrogenase
MGNSSEGVVDPQLRVNGLSGLRVADASVFSFMISSNTHFPTIMVGERAASLVLNETSSKPFLRWENPLEFESPRGY